MSRASVSTAQRRGTGSGHQAEAMAQGDREYEDVGVESGGALQPHGGGPLFTLTTRGCRALERDMAERDAWPATALGTLSETGREVLRLAAGLMDRLADVEVAREGGALPAGRTCRTYPQAHLSDPPV
ncbi:hypothetical protein [Streptomyces sp. NPDC058255]|uniref:hypothetical protein n=1 Tax=Streptomyces sp. NPDC058255 TaxID=3346407 RepID=UPI0036E53721